MDQTAHISEILSFNTVAFEVNRMDQDQIRSWRERLCDLQLQWMERGRRESSLNEAWAAFSRAWYYGRAAAWTADLSYNPGDRDDWVEAQVSDRGAVL